jgi:hypothetical protein
MKLPTKLSCSLQDVVSFLLQAYKYAKFQCLSKDGWTQAMQKSIFVLVFGTANNVKQNNAPKTIVTLPFSWLQHKELGIK